MLGTGSVCLIGDGRKKEQCGGIWWWGKQLVNAESDVQRCWLYGNMFDWSQHSRTQKKATMMTLRKKLEF